MIRRPRRADLPRLRAVQASLAEPWPALLEAAVEGLPHALVVTDGDRPVGYAVALADGTDAYLAELAVAPGSRGEGRGSRLLTALLDRLAAAGHDRVRVTARAGDPAVGFYERRGFEARERLPDHFEGGDGLVLVRGL